MKTTITPGVTPSFLPQQQPAESSKDWQHKTFPADPFSVTLDYQQAPTASPDVFSADPLWLNVAGPQLNDSNKVKASIEDSQGKWTDQDLTYAGNGRFSTQLPAELAQRGAQNLLQVSVDNSFITNKDQGGPSFPFNLLDHTLQFIGDKTDWQHAHLRGDAGKPVDVNLDYQIQRTNWRGNNFYKTAPLWMNVSAAGLGPSDQVVAHLDGQDVPLTYANGSRFTAELPDEDLSNSGSESLQLTVNGQPVVDPVSGTPTFSYNLADAAGQLPR